MIDLEEMDAVFFDLDGVLAETEHLKIKAYREAFKRHGIDISEQEFKAIHCKAEDSTKEIIRLFNPALDYKTIRDLESRIFLQNLNNLDSRPGIREVLDYMSKNEYWVCLCSGGRRKHVLTELDLLGLKKYFHHITTGEDVAKNKPFPDIYLHAAAVAQVSPERSLAIEDSERGVIAAKSAGFFCLAFPTNFFAKQDFSKADGIIYDMRDFYEKLLRGAVNEK
jgi:beta-phosphoglucomutase